MGIFAPLVLALAAVAAWAAAGDADERFRRDVAAAVAQGDAGRPGVAARQARAAWREFEVARPADAAGWAPAAIAVARLCFDADDAATARTVLDATQAWLDGAGASADAARRSASLERVRLTTRDGRFAEALRERERLDVELVAAAGDADVQTLRNRIGLAALLGEVESNERALALAASTLRSARAALGATHAVTLAAAANYARLLQIGARYDEALRVVDAALAEALQALGTDHAGTVALIKQRGVILAEQGHNEEALPAFERVYAWSDAEFGPEALSTINALEWLGFVYSGLARDDDAVAATRKAHRALVVQLGATHPRTLLAAGNLAYFLALDGRAPEALALLDAVIGESLARYGPMHERTVILRTTRAEILLDGNGPAQACAEYADLRGDARLADPGLDRVRVDVTVGWARCRLLAGDVDAARTALQAAWQARGASAGADSDEALAVLAMLAHTDIDAGDRVAASAHLETLVAGVERLRSSEAPEAGSGRSAFANRVAGRGYRAGYRDLALLYAQDGRAREAIALSELARARGVNEAIAQRDPGIGDRPRLRIAALETQLRQLDAERALLPAVSPELARRNVERAAIVAELDRERQVARAPDGVPDPVGFARRSLPPGTAIVGLQLARRGAWAYVLRQGRAPEVVALEADPGTAARVDALREALAAPDPKLAPLWRTGAGDIVVALSRPDPAARPVAPAALGAQLAATLLRPLAPYLRDSRSVVFVVDGALARFPLESLDVDGQPLGARRDVRYSPSLAVWAQVRQWPAAGKRARDLVAFGAPDYAQLAPGGPGPLARLRWGALPGAAAEVDAIVKLFAPARRESIAGDAATKRRFIALGTDGTLRESRFVHIAAHGYLSGAQPQWSALVLRGEGNSLAYVTAAELATFDLGADLVVLSACETALGKDVAGEGLFGLPYALTVAGARATLLTLWPVSDASAAAFMTRFYAKLARGVAPAAALAATKREFMRIPAYSAPFHWAPYVLVGG